MILGLKKMCSYQNSKNRFSLDVLDKILPVVIVDIIYHFAPVEIACPVDTWCANKYIFFIHNIRKWHNYYLHCNNQNLYIQYLNYLILCMQDLLTTNYKNPDDCRYNSYKAKIIIRKNTIKKLGWKIKQICAKIRVSNNPTFQICLRCDNEKHSFRRCYSAWKWDIIIIVARKLLSQYK